jgi:hypothetical protein
LLVFPQFVNACYAQLGALQRLNRLLSSPVLYIKQHAALSLSFLCSTNASAQLAAVDSGALSVVQDLLRSSRSQIVVTGLRFIFNLACVVSPQHFMRPSAFPLICRYDNTRTQEQFLTLGVISEIVSMLKSAKLSREEVNNPVQSVDSPGSDSDKDSEDAGCCMSPRHNHPALCTDNTLSSQIPQVMPLAASRFLSGPFNRPKWSGQ